jgi:hypothetical protein
MACLLSPFLYSLPPISSFLDLVAMTALPPSNASAQEGFAQNTTAGATCWMSA